VGDVTAPADRTDDTADPRPDLATIQITTEVLQLIPPGRMRIATRVDDGSVAITIHRYVPLDRDRVVRILRDLTCTAIRDHGGSLQGVANRWHAGVIITINIAP
jgi:hypothetical protein